MRGEGGKGASGGGAMAGRTSKRCANLERRPQANNTKAALAADAAMLPKPKNVTGFVSYVKNEVRIEGGGG